MSIAGKPVYKRVLLKLSGEAFIHKLPPHELGAESGFGIDPEAITRIASEVLEAISLGIEIAIVIGGGNFFRGRALIPLGVDPITADQMGMLSTVMNALAFKDVIKKFNQPCRILSAISMGHLVECYNRDRAVALLESGEVVLFAGGTGNPLVTTDSAASLRGIEIKADIILKGTLVEGVYSKDPQQDPSAVFYSHIDFDQAITQELKIMDPTAFYQCRAHHLPIRVFNIRKAGALLRALLGQQEGTLVSSSLNEKS